LDTTGKILLLEDDIELGETIKELLELEGMSVVWVKDALSASEATYNSKFDLYIFDINVPAFSGLELLEDLREARDLTPTIFISALIDIKSISRAFNIGAEDYIKKPFFPEELLIRIRAKFKQKDRPIVYRDIIFYPKNKEIYKNKEPINLSPMQYELFSIFIKNRGKIIYKNYLLEQTGIKSFSALRVAIAKLKQSLDLNIVNIHGVGYRLEES
jgi:DNA-binding response OmpR family regulator